MYRKTWILLTVIVVLHFELVVVMTQRVNQFWVSHNSDTSANASASLKNNVYRLSGFIKKKTNNRRVDPQITRLTRIDYGRELSESGVLPNVEIPTDLASSESTSSEPKEGTKSVYVVAENDFDYGGYGGVGNGAGKKSKKKYRKQKHAGKKRLKHMAMGVIGLKMLYYHFLMKKMFALSLFSAILSKLSILLSSVLAIKQLFQSQHQEKPQDAKLEVVHIPVHHHSKGHDYDYRRIQKDPEHQYYNYIPLADQQSELLPAATDRLGGSLRPYHWLLQK